MSAAPPSIGRRLAAWAVTIVVVAAGFAVGWKLLGAVLLALRSDTHTQPAAGLPEYRILCLGESTTADQWPPLLGPMLAQSRPDVDFHITDRGFPGANTSSIVHDAPRNLEEFKPHLVVVMMGVNDMFYDDDAGKSQPASPPASKDLVKLGVYERSIGEHDKAIEIFRDLLARGEADNAARVELGRTLWELLRYDEAEAVLREAVERDPKDAEAWMLLARAVRSLRRWDEATTLIERALALDPNYAAAQREAGVIRRKAEDCAGAVPHLERAVALDPDNADGLMELQRCYHLLGRGDQERALLDRLEQKGPKTGLLYDLLAYGYMAAGRYDESRRYLDLATALREAHPQSRTRLNYRRLVELCRARGVGVVAVQYPMLSVAPLKAMLADEPGVRFVDNEATFFNALKEGRYSDLFIDNFGGVFGHCTAKGNEMLARNIARVVLESVPDPFPADGP